MLHHRTVNPAERAMDIAERDSADCEVSEWPRLTLQLFKEYVREFAEVVDQEP